MAEQREHRDGERRHEHWRLDKKIPAALIFLFMIQTGTLVWWVATTQATNNARLGQLEKESIANGNIKAVERLVTLEVTVGTLVQEIRAMRDESRRRP